MARTHGGDASAARITHFLGGMQFPASRDQLIHQAQQNDAGAKVLELLERMPNRDYGSMADVMKGVGQVH